MATVAPDAGSPDLDVFLKGVQSKAQEKKHARRLSAAQVKIRNALVMEGITPRLAARKQVIEKWTHTHLSAILFVIVILSFALVGLSSLYVSRANKLEVGATLGHVMVCCGAVLGMSGLVGVYGARRVLEDIKQDDDGLGTPGQKILEAYFHCTCGFVFFVIPVSCSALIDSNSFLTASGGQLDALGSGVAALALFIAFLSMLSLIPTVFIVTLWEISHSFLETFSTILVAIGVTGVILSIRLLDYAQFLGELSEVSSLLSYLYLFIATCALLIVFSVIGFGAAFIENANMIKVHIAAMSTLFIFLLATLAGFATSDLGGQVSTNCRQVMRVMSYEWWNSTVGCSKYGGPAQGAKVETFDETLGKFVYSSSGVGESALCAQVNQTAFAWEYYDSQMLTLLASSEESSVNLTSTRPIRMLQGCLNLGCCQVLLSGLSQFSSLIATASLLLVASVLVAIRADVWLMRHAMQETDRVKLISEFRMKCLASFVLVLIVIAMVTLTVTFNATSSASSQDEIVAKITQLDARSQSAISGGRQEVISDTAPLHFCDDGVRNGNETDIDCGGDFALGGCAARCAIARRCVYGSDCASSYCDTASHLCRPPSTLEMCTNGVRDGGETSTDCGGADCRGLLLASTEAGGDVDLGGASMLCPLYASCVEDEDCSSGYCDQGSCSSCQDGVKNSDEGDVDCGSQRCVAYYQAFPDDSPEDVCPVVNSDQRGLCLDGRSCASPDQCASGICWNNVCVSCSNGMRDGDETDVDCGGKVCDRRCPVGKHCKQLYDCSSRQCSSSCESGFCDEMGTCETVFDASEGTDPKLAAMYKDDATFESIKLQCSNGVLDHGETSVDCGGPLCTLVGLSCEDGDTCSENSDCTSNLCIGSSCVSCQNGLKDGDETDADCGGTVCASRCDISDSCTENSDCGSGLFCWREEDLELILDYAAANNISDEILNATYIPDLDTCQQYTQGVVQAHSGAVPDFRSGLDLSLAFSLVFVPGKAQAAAKASNQTEVEGRRILSRYDTQSRRNLDFSLSGGLIGVFGFTPIDDPWQLLCDVTTVFKLQTMSVRFAVEDAKGSSAALSENDRTLTVKRVWQSRWPRVIIYPTSCDQSFISGITISRADRAGCNFFLFYYGKYYDARFAVSKNTIVYGKVVTDGDKPLANAYVRIWQKTPREQDTGLYRETTCFGSDEGSALLAITDSTGFFRIDLPELTATDGKQYLWSFSVAQDSSITSKGNLITAEAGSSNDLGQLYLAPAVLPPCGCRSYESPDLESAAKLCKNPFTWHCVGSDTPCAARLSFDTCDNTITFAPTSSPSTSPTRNPTESPTVSPTKSPSGSPTRSPTLSPSTSPTASPTSSPTVSPTTSPTGSPTLSPSTSPTRSPSFSPSDVPTGSPTKSPSASPTVSPTTSPSDSPTGSPTTSPTTSPTDSPTSSPTASPTSSPTSSPTLSPTSSPTLSPTLSPTKSPTQSPTSSPTSSPTLSPTSSPTESPTTSPTLSPTASPTRSPTESPTASPTAGPTSSPTDSPSASPTASPTNSPSESPTSAPSLSPSNVPTHSPTKEPTQSPSVSPTKKPTKSPTASPTDAPSTSPTTSPTKEPTTSPSSSPTKNPSVSPTKSPTRSPSTSPTRSPTRFPTFSPTAAKDAVAQMSFQSGKFQYLQDALDGLSKVVGDLSKPDAESSSISSDGSTSWAYISTFNALWEESFSLRVGTSGQESGLIDSLDVEELKSSVLQARCGHLSVTACSVVNASFSGSEFQFALRINITSVGDASYLDTLRTSPQIPSGGRSGNSLVQRLIDTKLSVWGLLSSVEGPYAVNTEGTYSIEVASKNTNEEESRVESLQKGLAQVDAKSSLVQGYLNIASNPIVEVCPASRKCNEQGVCCSSKNQQDLGCPKLGVCFCNEGYSGPNCEYQPTPAPTLPPTRACIPAALVGGANAALVFQAICQQPGACDSQGTFCEYAPDATDLESEGCPAGRWVPVFQQKACSVRLNLGRTMMNALFQARKRWRYDIGGKPYLYYVLLEDLDTYGGKYDVFEMMLRNWASLDGTHVINEDFALYGTATDLVQDRNRWQWSNYDDGTGFPRDARPVADVGILERIKYFYKWASADCASGYKISPLNEFSFYFCLPSGTTVAASQQAPEQKLSTLDINVVDSVTGRGVEAKVRLFRGLTPAWEKAAPLFTKVVDVVYAEESMQDLPPLKKCLLKLESDRTPANGTMTVASASRILEGSSVSFDGLAAGTYTIVFTYEQGVAENAISAGPFETKVVSVQVTNEPLTTKTIAVSRVVKNGSFLIVFSSEDLALDLITTFQTDAGKCQISSRMIAEGACACGGATIVRSDSFLGKDKKAIQAIQVNSILTTTYSFTIGRSRPVPSSSYKKHRDDGRCGYQYPLESGEPAECPPVPVAWADGTIDLRPCCEVRAGTCGSSFAWCNSRYSVDYSRFYKKDAWKEETRADLRCNMLEYPSSAGTPSTCPEQAPCCGPNSMCGATEYHCQSDLSLDFTKFYESSSDRTLGIAPTEEANSEITVYSSNGVSRTFTTPQASRINYFDGHVYDGTASASSIFTRMFCIDGKEGSLQMHEYPAPRFFQWAGQLEGMSKDCPSTGDCNYLSIGGLLNVERNDAVKSRDLNGLYVRRYSENSGFQAVPNSQISLDLACRANVLDPFTGDNRQRWQIDNVPATADCLEVCESDDDCEAIVVVNTLNTDQSIRRLCRFHKTIQSCGGIIPYGISYTTNLHVYIKSTSKEEAMPWYSLRDTLFSDNKVHLYRDPSSLHWFIDDDLVPANGHYASLRETSNDQPVPGRVGWRVVTNFKAGLSLPVRAPLSMQTVVDDCLVGGNFPTLADSAVNQACQCGGQGSAKKNCKGSTCGVFKLRISGTFVCLEANGGAIITNRCDDLLGRQKFVYNSAFHRLEASPDAGATWVQLTLDQYENLKTAVVEDSTVQATDAVSLQLTAEGFICLLETSKATSYEESENDPRRCFYASKVPGDTPILLDSDYKPMWTSFVPL